MNLQPLDVGVIRGRIWQPMDWFIYQRTSTLWGHCVVIKNDSGDCFDPRFKGILNNNISRYDSRGYKIRRYKYPMPKNQMFEWCLDKQKKAKHYDFKAMGGYVTGIPGLQDENSWTCAEFPYWMFMDNGCPLTDEIMAFVFPSFFMQSNDFITVE